MEKPSSENRLIEASCHCQAVRWSFKGQPESVTTCNCTLCRRWGALWAYGFKDEEIRVTGTTQAYLRDPKTIEFHFCSVCGCVVYWCTPEPGEDGRRYMAVNMRMADPAEISTVPLNRFDGCKQFEALPPDGTCVADLWF